MKIGEISKITGCSVQSIRFYEKEDLLKSTVRSEGNFRLYNEEAVKEISFILRCRSLDISIPEIRQLKGLIHRPNEDCQDVNSIFDKHINQVNLKIKELRELKNELKNLRKKCTDKNIVDKCEIIKELSK